jgi:disulfide bond formation protein DsbB
VGSSLYATSSDRIALRGRPFISLVTIALGIAAISALSLAGALGIEHIGGIAPCPLCLEQRIAYYAAVPVALIAAWLVPRVPLAARLLLAALALGFLFNAGLGVYHSGIEWGWWPGPEECSGMAPLASTPAEMQEALKHPSVVRCDAAALRILGISLAGYSALISAILAIAAAVGVFPRQSPKAAP